jgi:GNAT superfamily N-acetyltransferase
VSGSGKAAATPQTAEITEAELPAVAAFISTQFRPGEARDPGALPLADRLRWVLLDNPARQADVPIGWCIRDNGRVVGCLLAVPYRIGAGTFSCTALVASHFYVEQAHRGAGIGPFMRYLSLRSRHLLLNMTANEVSGKMFSRCGGRAIAGTGHTMLGVIRQGPLIEEWIFRRSRSRLLARASSWPGRLAPPRFRGIAPRDEKALQPLRSADEAAAIGLPPTGDKLAVVRDPSYLHWRYFTGDHGKDVWRFESDSESARLVVANRVRLGYRGQIRVLNVLDVWPATTPQSALLLASQLAHHYHGAFDAIWFRSQSPDAESVLQSAGFVRHDFPAPLGWCIDAESRLPTQEFYLMPGESE